MNSLFSTSACFGFCADCGTTHALPIGNSRKYALELMEQLEQHKRLDFLATSNPQSSIGNQQFSTDYLWGDARGQMFGVLECENADGSTVVLKAFSSQYDGEWIIDGWAPPILDPNVFNELIAEPDEQINIRTRALQDIEESDPQYTQLFQERKALSRQLMKQIHDLYQLTNFKGESRPLTDFFPNIGIPTGAGECCAPKLLNHAAINGLKPVGISEFYFGKESKSGERKHGEFYPACADKCRPILGFMLCGSDMECAGLPAPSAPVLASELPDAGQAPLNKAAASHRTPKGSPALQILHADDDIVVINKPSGLLSVPGKGPENQDCVVSRIKELFPDCPDHPEVHRLDMDTSGLMVFARTRDAHRELNRQFHDRETKKQYIALLDGELAEEKGVIKLPFRLDVDNRPMQIYDPVHGKLGITRWEKRSVENGKTRVAFFPITGRTHQLRVHAASEHGLGLPIIGDRLYGTGTEPGQLKLHASLLIFVHPRTGRKLTFTSEPDF
jgi:tRNA pseudouridine32 synthase/23S rRNA pseudouridine746 synthase